MVETSSPRLPAVMGGISSHAARCAGRSSSHRGWAAAGPPSGTRSCPCSSWWRRPGPAAPPARAPAPSCPPGRGSPPCTEAQTCEPSLLLEICSFAADLYLHGPVEKLPRIRGQARHIHGGALQVASRPRRSRSTSAALWFRCLKQ